MNSSRNLIFIFFLSLTSCIGSGLGQSPTSTLSSTFLVTPSGDGNETISPPTPTIVNPGSTLTFTVTAQSGYVLSSVVGGTCAAGSFAGIAYTTGAITSNCSLSFSATLLPSITSISPSSGSASGGTGVTISGSNFTGSTSVTFGGIAATSVNVVNDTTLTVVTPAHAVAVVDVVVTTPLGSGTSANGYTYVSTAVGQSAFGGTVACMNGGNNLIASVTDNGNAIAWGGFGTMVGAASTTDGASNTVTIVSTLGPNGGSPYAAQICTQYQVDSQGNSPCEAGNACYNDWFLPAGHNLTATGQLNCLYNNQSAIGGFSTSFYLSSTEFDATTAWGQDFSSSAEGSMNKINLFSVRCVRAFSP
jgi:hypothetical protein